MLNTNSQANFAIQQPTSDHVAMGMERELQSLLRKLNGLHGLLFLLVSIHPLGRIADEAMRTNMAALSTFCMISDTNLR